MYRVNLYPEFEGNRLAARRRAVRAAVYGVVLGIEVALIGALAVSAGLLGERAAALRAGLPRLESRIQAGAGSLPELQAARDLLQVRRERIDWSPKLAALSEQLDASLLLMRVTGHAPSRNSAARFEIEGIVRDGGRSLEQVSGLMARLRDEPRFSSDFPVVNLGTLGKQGTNRFELQCAPAGANP
ncbi:MAG: hypothetical protein HZB25_05960 [Candidatus Eisenbacteria bacterium]|nr:hypothetical protein [Candidatus Eisenbacteria bacterium]